MLHIRFIGTQHTRKLWDSVRCITLPMVKSTAARMGLTVRFSLLRDVPQTDLPPLTQQLSVGNEATLLLPHGVEDNKAFAEQLANELSAALNPFLITQEALQITERSLEFHRTFLEQQHRAFCGDDGVVDTLLTRLEAGERELALQGASGSGKTALCGRLVSRLEQAGWTTLPLTVGLSHRTATTTDILSHWVWYLELLLEDVGHLSNIADSETDHEDPPVGEWLDRFEALCRRFVTTEHRLVLILDGVDALFPDDDRAALRFLPSVLGENLRIIVTTDGTLSMPSCSACAIPVPDRAAVSSMAQQMAARDVRRVEPALLDAVAERALEQGAAAPLYLTLALRWLYITPPAERSAEPLPQDVEKLALALVRHLQGRLQAPALWDTLRLLSLTVNGLRDAKLSTLFGSRISFQTQENATLYRCLYALGPCLVEGEDGRYRIAHTRVRRALQSTFTADSRRTAHQTLGSLMGDRMGSSDPCYVEAAYHYMQAGDMSALGDFITFFRIRASGDARVQAARHMVRFCLMDGGAQLYELASAKGTGSAHVVQFFVTYCAPRFPTDRHAQQLLLRLEHRFYHVLRNRPENTDRVLLTLLQDMLRHIPAAYFGEDRRCWTAYFGYAFYRLAKRVFAQQETLRHRHTLRQAAFLYADGLQAGSLRRDLFEQLRGDYISYIKLNILHRLWQDGEDTYDDLLQKRRELYEGAVNRSTLTDLLDTYAELAEYAISEGICLTTRARTYMEEARDLVAYPECDHLQDAERRWITALADTAIDPTNAAAAHAYTAACAERYGCEQTDRTARALTDAVRREYAVLVQQTELSVSLPVLLTAAKGDDLCRIKIGAPIRLRKQRLPEQGTLRQRLLAAREQAWLYRLDDTADTAVYDTLDRLLQECRAPHMRQEVLDSITDLLAVTRQRVSDRAFWRLLCHLWHAPQPPEEADEQLASGYARWALLAAEGLTQTRKLRLWPFCRPSFARRQALCAYVRDTARRCRAQQTLLALAALPHSGLSFAERLEICREAMYHGKDPVVRVQGHRQTAQLLWAHRDTLDEEQRRLGAEAAANMYLLSGEYRYYTYSVTLDSAYLPSRLAEDHPVPRPDAVVAEPPPAVPLRKRSSRRMRVVLEPQPSEGTYCGTCLTIPAVVQVIRADALACAPHLTDLTVPSTVKVIERGAFRGCTRLQHLVLPKIFRGQDLGLPEQVRVTYV